MILGIDYASVDGNKPPDFTAAKTAGLRFAFVRASYSTWVDPICARDRDAIRAAGLVFGAYLFPVLSGPSPEHQVATFAAGAGLAPHRDFAPVLDIEFPGGIAKKGLSRKQCAEWIARAIAALRHTFGATPIIYTSARVLDGNDEDGLAGEANGAIKGCPLWLARYPFKTRIEPHLGATLAAPPVPMGLDADAWWCHQFQGDAVHFLGFTATVDVNRFNPLRFGMQGERVRWLQARLNAAVDGDFDDVTREYLQRYQETHGLAADGVVGPATFGAVSWEA